MADIHEVYVKHKTRNIEGDAVQAKSERALGVKGIQRIDAMKVIRLEGVPLDQVETIAHDVLANPITQEFLINPSFELESDSHVLEVGYKPGVMNPEVGTLLDYAKHRGFDLEAADTSMRYVVHGDVSEEDIDKLSKNLVNGTVQRLVTEKPETLIIKGERGPVNVVSLIDATDDELMDLSKDKLFLDLDEMKVSQAYFRNKGRNPTDVELEAIAAWESDHCKHKTFSDIVVTPEGEKTPLFARIKETAAEFIGEDVLSAFSDNSGVVRLPNGWAFNIKIESHNSPLNVEPYGGAGTGSGGAFRDNNETGKAGVTVVLSFVHYATAPMETPESDLPEGVLSPEYILTEGVAGVGDYGNRMGIPTLIVSTHEHPDFRAKSTILAGGIGFGREENAKKGVPEVDDLIVLVGGKTGRDGIHGATFSSAAMTDRTATVNSTAVQIGNAIEEKRMFEALNAASDKGLIRAVTDCGAAGLSSAAGEIGKDLGIDVDLSQVPLKYEGLAPWEIWISESQERSVAAVDPSNIDEFLTTCKKYNVEATVIGKFDGNNKMHVRYDDEVVADLDYDFLENGFPQRKRNANWIKPEYDDSLPELPTDWLDSIKKVMAHGNVRSTRPISKKFDTSVQGGTALERFTGINKDGPNDAAVINPLLEEQWGIITSYGMNPILNNIDPYWGSIWAFTEAAMSYAVTGGDIEKCVMVNNYVSPVPNEQYMGALDMMVDAVCDSMRAIKRPVISGKDSVSSTYRGKDGTVINIPPELCMTLAGQIDDVSKTTSSDIKEVGSTLVLIGEPDPAMGGSVYFQVNNLVGNEVPKADLITLLKTAKDLHEGALSGLILSGHRVTKGGIISAVSKMCIGGDCGVELDVNGGDRPDLFLFNETPHCAVVEVTSPQEAKELFGDIPYQILGITTKEKTLKVTNEGVHLFDADVDEIRQAWQAPLQPLLGKI